MRFRTRLLFAVLALSAAAAAWCTGNIPCAVHFGAQMYSTGQTKTVEGHLFTKYHCPQGEDYWVKCD